MGSTTEWTQPDTTQRPIAIIGGGVLGRRLAMMWSAAGYRIQLCEKIPEVATAALEFIRDNVEQQTARLNSRRSLSKSMATTTTTTGARSSSPGAVEVTPNVSDAVHNAWMVIEAIPEILELKVSMFEELDRLAPPDCILATNSSSYKSSELVTNVTPDKDDGRDGRQRILNTHYYMPPDQNYVELMTCGGHTHEAIFPFLMEKAADAGFVPIHAKVESTGFIFNRIWAAVKRECLAVMADGVAEAKDIDLMFRGWFDAKVGPCLMMDRVGLDTVWNIEQHYIRERGLDSRPNDWLKENYVDKGLLGRKSGKGLIYGRDEEVETEMENGKGHA